MVEPNRSEPLKSETDEHLHDIWTVANIVTLLRLLLIPFFFSVLISDKSNVLAFSLFAGAASTDWLDGWIARKTGTVTAIGKAIDPLVDRMLLATGVVGLYLVGRLPLWVVFVLVARDVYLLYGAYRLEHHQMRMPVTYAGKVTTATLLAGFSLLMLGWPEFTLGGTDITIGLAFVYAGLTLSLGTAIQYTYLARRMVARPKQGSN
ncbi:MAG: CDP-alcohol phosphatidyltransferase family protein [Actinomycetota bacterium]|nr:CDP-alcohol phosphatidyltransferase family protein [Actinomycetota bacterium]